MSVLTGLRLWHSQQLQGGLQGFVLNPVFKDNLRIALLGGWGTRLENHRHNAHPYFYELFRRNASCVVVSGKPWADEGSSLGPDRHARDVESLDRYAMERWEVILHFMVGSPSAAVSQDLAQLLTQAGLMRRYRTVTAVIKCFKQSRSDKNCGLNVLDLISQWCWWGPLYHISRVSVSAAGHGLSAVVLYSAVPQNRTGQCFFYLLIKCIIKKNNYLQIGTCIYGLWKCLYGPFYRICGNCCPTSKNHFN